MRTVFLSHRRPEQEDADRLRARLPAGWRATSHPVEPELGEAWRDACRARIEAADAVVCIVGDRTAESPNVDWELETAYALGRPVVAVRAARARMPHLPAPLAARGARLAGPDDLAELAYERTG